jgi:hypothetical protein
MRAIGVQRREQRVVGSLLGVPRGRREQTESVPTIHVEANGSVEETSTGPAPGTNAGPLGSVIADFRLERDTTLLQLLGSK